MKAIAFTDSARCKTTWEAALQFIGLRIKAYKKERIRCLW